MIVKIYSVYDQAASAFMQPFFFATKGLAIRSFTEAVNSPDQLFNKYPSDYVMFELGEFEDSSAVIRMHAVPERVISALECVIPTTTVSAVDRDQVELDLGAGVETIGQQEGTGDA